MIRMSRYIRTLIILLAAVQTVGTMKAQDETSGTGGTASTGPKIQGNVFGGGNLAKVEGSVTVNMSAGTVANDVYGGGAKAETNTSSTETVTNVTLSGGTVTGSVYGGGLGQPAVAEQAPIPANVNGTVTVTVSRGTAYNVYGCNNLQGAPQKDVTVNIQGGTINNNVFGGGNQADAPGQITVNITGGTVTNDVYGGGALASTNTRGTTTTNPETNVTTTTYPTTYVSLTGGIVGNAYGGGLGDADTPAYVWGDVTVDVNGTAFTQTYQDYNNSDGSSIPKTGQVFGCNNINGSPKGKVTVHVHKTVGLNADGTVNSTKPEKNSGLYELLAVYGGGNLAPYEPVKAESESTTDTDEATYTDNTIASTNVIIDGCELTSIKQVYGGGNAASTPSTKVQINGSYEIDEVFGGGNGKDMTSATTTNPGAHVGFKAYTEDDENSKATSKYGKGVGRVNINGGVIHAVYGGSNTKGNVRRVAVAMLDQTSEENCFAVDEAYGGGKSAPMDGRAILDLGCIPGVGTVYGGARAATVNNDVVLTITNGTYTNVFGGNNVEGDIKGSITVNIEETGCRPIRITNLYGGGNKAAYTTPEGKSDPTINILSCTKIDNVYGGGLGSTAIINGNTNVNINMVKGRWSQANSPVETNTYSETGAANLGEIGHVYGGGYGADVTGNTNLNIGTAPTVTFASLTDDPATDGDERMKQVEGANITGDVFGGGYGADTKVKGTAYVNIGEMRTTTTTADPTAGTEASTTVSYIDHDATANGNFGGNIYGGSALGTVYNSQVNLYAGNISKSVFGGGMGELASGTEGQEGYVAGQAAVVTSKAEVNLYAATTNNIYGGCNVNGTAGRTEVKLYGGKVGDGTIDKTNNTYSRTAVCNVFGGGFGKNTYVSGNVQVNIGESGATDGPTIYGDVYGGGALGHVNAEKNTAEGATTPTYNANNTTSVNLYSGTIYGDAYGGGLGEKAGINNAEADYAAHVGGDINVTLDGTAFVIEKVATTDMDENNNAIRVVNTGRVFGSNNLCGSPNGNITVTVNKTAEGNITKTSGTLDGKILLDDRDYHSTYELAAVYGGGNLASYTATGKKTHVVIKGCDQTSIETVYGGGNAAAVPETDVDIYGTYEIGAVFGGGNGKDKYLVGTTWTKNPGANVNGSTNTMLYGGVVHEAYGASNEEGTIMGNVSIDVSDTNPEGTCILDLGKFVGAGKNADVNGSLRMIMGCKPSDKIPIVYGGADNANVNGDVELTITSGNFGQVFGGNNRGGSILGHIILNIEETGECGTPINIDQLYLGGNMAAYSVYGYYKDNEGKLKPRESAGDTRKPVKWDNTSKQYVEYSGTEGDTFAGYDQPILNIVSCTSIGKVFGGGYGEGGDMYASPTVNINMIPGSQANKIDGDNDGSPDNNPNSLGAIGDVFGGGDAAKVLGDVTVNIGTERTVRLHQSLNADGTYTWSDPHDVLGAKITGNVYGGGNLANVGKYHEETDKIDIVGHTFVNICAVRGTEILDAQNQGTGRYNYTAVNLAESATGVTIGGNVFGGGKGEAADPGTGTLAGAFRCGKAMVTGATNVAIGNGTVNGTVYGGGEVGRVEQNTSVTIGMGDGAATGGTSTPVIMKDVYGAGKGVMTHGYAALVRGHAYVNVAGNAQVRHSVYGGGEIASVGRYNIADAAYHAQHPEVEEGMPYSLKDQVSGYCYVNVGGYAEIGEDDMSMTKAGGPDDFGYIFGAGKGILPYEGYTSTETPWRVHPSDIKEEYTSEKENDYLLFIESLALATHTYVTVGGHAFVKGSVYGGSENGHVQHDTDVRIQDHCQIGNGWDATQNQGVNARYDEALFINPATATPDQINTSAAALKECSSWVFGKDTNSDDKADTFEPYDKHGAAGGGAIMASDGHTFYGNVFGGGSGLYAFDRQNRISGKDNHEWLRSAGRVYGNTNVTITGGHILTSVYGGCELTDVGNGRSIEEGKGKCTVKMSGGTLGVPRTLAQIAAHPVTCYLFGAGKGDQRVHFNQWTNVDNVEVEVSGNAIIYGSVFGGGEDGHVLGDTKVTIKENAVIGTWGTSYVDGNIFGAGRGFGGDALTAGVVCGNVDIDIQGGTLLGSVYGGGRLGSVGTYLVPSTHADYGKLIPDGKTITINEDAGTATETDQEGITHGEISISISGGIIGNNIEYAYIAPTVTGDALTTAKTYMPNTDHDGQNRLTHTKGGNVFAGAMGRLNGLAEGTFIEHWPDLGKAKKTTLNISGGTIKSNVYGGGELGTLEQGSTISITGGTIGSEISEAGTTGNGVRYTFGSVFGGGAGSDAHRDGKLANNTIVNTDDHAGLVKGSTKITMSAGAVKGSVYGGGELAIVQGSHTTSDSKTVGTEINIIGGSIGYNQDGFGGATMGNVYGAGKGSLETKQAGLIKSNTLINISGGNIYHNIYGGGAYGSVGTFTYEIPSGSTQPASTPSGCTEGGTAWINITGGTIGINGHENGMVFGSSRGDVAIPDASGEDPNNKLAWVKNTYVTIGTLAGSNSAPWIMGSVYGSGENGHVLTNTDVTIHDGKIGIEEDDGATYDITSGNTTYKGAAYPSRGNVYGGGCGTDTYAVTTGTGDDAVTKYYFNRSAGIVRGNSTITMDGGQVVRTIYGGGAMGSIGKFTRESKVESDPYNSDSHVPGIVSSCAENTGLATVSISGGTVGPKIDTTIPDGAGNVFGASRGEIHDATEYPNLERMVFVDKTDVNISDAAIVKGSVYGGSEAGHVLSITDVSMTDGSVGQNIYGGGNLGDVGLYTTDAGGANIYAEGKGVCQVSISGGTVTGNVFGAGKGEGTTFTCEKAMVNSTTVTVEDGTVNGNVYGGGEVGRVESNTVVTIGKADDDSSAPDIKGSVFGAGAGLETHGYSALVRGNTTVNVQGSAKVGHNVYGGGETASVGRYGLDAEKMPSILLGGGVCAVTVGGNAVIGQGATGNVFGACKGVDPHFDKDNADKTLRSRRMTMYNATEFLDADKGTKWEYYAEGSPYVWEYYQDEASYTKYLETLALATRPTVTIKGSAGVNGSVYGGGERGITKGTVAVNIEGGTVAEDVYGGGALANTNTTKLVGVFENGIPRKDTEGNYVTTEVHPTTTVNLTGGSFRDAYGGGLGQLASGTQKAIPAEVGGDVTVTLDGSTVNGSIFGANNINGTPLGHVLVHVKRTIRRDGHTYDVDAVFGGGNNADYVPTDTKQYSEVIIEGCDLTSINQVYGGGNAAATPGTSILVKGTKIIHELFGGGNGERGAAYAANVGYHFDGTNRTDYARGDGKALVQLMAGKIDFVYGGSNSNGDIRGGSTTSNIPITGTSPECCSDLQVGRIFGGGKNADMASGSDIVIECQTSSSWIEEIYAGAENANVGGNVRLTITSGKFGRVFGGNKSGGRLNGSITVNIEESPSCGIPVIIGELYAGGNKAPYSIYGYDDGGTMLTSGVAKHASPVVNVRAFTSIGNIFGGGYGEDAVMYGSPTININEVEVDHTDKSNAEFQGNLYRGETKTIVVDPGETPYDVVLYPHEDGKMGVIGNVYGGGNAAKVYGDTNVNIGTKTTDVFHTPLKKTVHNSQMGVDEEVATDEADRTHTVKGADIRGNVYGGGNEAEVTGDTNVKIGITATP